MCVFDSLTSSALDSTVLPAAVSPDVEILWFFLLFAAPVLGCVQRHCVLIVDFITLVMKEQHLEHNGEGLKEKRSSANVKKTKYYSCSPCTSIKY